MMEKKPWATYLQYLRHNKSNLSGRRAIRLPCLLDVLLDLFYATQSWEHDFECALIYQDAAYLYRKVSMA